MQSKRKGVCYVFCNRHKTNKYQKYKLVELADELQSNRKGSADCGVQISGQKIGLGVKKMLVGGINWAQTFCPEAIATQCLLRLLGHLINLKVFLKSLPKA